jgi:hypothetical protein
VALTGLCGAKLYGQVITPRTDDTARRKQIHVGTESAHDYKIMPNTRTPIPKEPFPIRPRLSTEQLFFKTWSLFLIALAQSNDRIKSLYDQFEAFGGAIGPDNLAVWFWPENVFPELLFKGVDVDRAAVFCTKLKLPPSGGPYILVTSDYPGEGLIDDPSSFLPTPLKSYYSVSLNNKSADEIIQLLTSVADKITADRLSDLDSSSVGWWIWWRRMFEGIRGFLSSRNDGKHQDTVLGRPDQITPVGYRVILWQSESGMLGRSSCCGRGAFSSARLSLQRSSERRSGRQVRDWDLCSS